MTPRAQDAGFATGVDAASRTTSREIGRSSADQSLASIVTKHLRGRHRAREHWYLRVVYSDSLSLPFSSSASVFSALRGRI